MHHVKIPISDQALLNNKKSKQSCDIIQVTAFRTRSTLLFHSFCDFVFSAIFQRWDSYSFQYLFHLTLLLLLGQIFNFSPVILFPYLSCFPFQQKSSVVFSLSVLKLHLETPVLKNLSFLFSCVSSFHTSVQDCAFTALSFVFTFLSPRFCFHSLGFHIECSKPQRLCSSEWHEPTLINLWHMPWMIAHRAFCYDSVKELQLMPLPAQLSGAPALQTNC